MNPIPGRPYTIMAPKALGEWVRYALAVQRGLTPFLYLTLQGPHNG